MKKSLKRKFFTLGSVVSLPVFALTLVSCTNYSTQTDQQIKEKIVNGDVSTNILTNYYQKIAQDKLGDNYDTLSKDVFWWYVQNKYSSDQNYWVSQYSSWIEKNEDVTGIDINASGQVSIEKNDWDVLKKIPALNLEINKILVSMSYLKASKDDVESYYNKKDDENADEKYIDASNYFLVKWLQDNKPSLVWQIKYNSFDRPGSTKTDAEWQAGLKTLQKKLQKNPFGNWNALLNNNVLASDTSINIDNIGGFLGIVTDNSQITASNYYDVNNLNYDNKNQSDPNFAKLGFVTPTGLSNTGASEAVPNNSEWIRSLVFQLVNKATQESNKYKYSMSEIMTNNEEFQNQIMFLIAVSNSGLVDTAREFWFTLGYQIESYVKAVTDQISSTDNLLA